MQTKLKLSKYPEVIVFHVFHAFFFKIWSVFMFLACFSEIYHVFLQMLPSEILYGGQFLMHFFSHLRLLYFKIFSPNMVDNLNASLATRDQLISKFSLTMVGKFEMHF